MTDYRKLYREGAMLLVRLHNAGSLDYSAVSDDDVLLMCKLSEIPKPGGPKPGSGRKPKRQKENC